MRFLRHCAAAVGKLSPLIQHYLYSPVALRLAFGVRGLAAPPFPSKFEAVTYFRYEGGMKRLIAMIAVATLLMLSPAPAGAAAGNFTLVNKTGSAIISLSIRRSGTSAWSPIGGNPANGSRTAVAFANPDCAFDIKADLGTAGNATFTGVNLCDVTTVTLNRGPSGDLWVDYD